MSRRVINNAMPIGLFVDAFQAAQRTRQAQHEDARRQLEEQAKPLTDKWEQDLLAACREGCPAVGYNYEPDVAGLQLAASVLRSKGLTVSIRERIGGYRVTVSVPHKTLYGAT